MSVLRVGHSPDADDAFMFYALANGKVTVEGFEVEQVLEDIESLNRRAMRGELEVTAISAAAYPRLADKYRIMACGASVGRNYGPTVVSTTPMTPDGLEYKRIAIPGEYTTAYLLIRIYLGRPFTPVFLHFDEIVEAVRTGDVDAGLIIHEGQITLEAQGYTTVLDLGKVWGDDTGLPIPLGLDMVHRRLGEDTSRNVARAFEASIRYAIAHEDAAVEYALPFGRGIDRDTCRRFVRMYVNEDTINMGEEGRKALETMYRRAHERGLIESIPPLDIVGL
ncbi:MAG: ABC transporter substrate-binding protein [Dehalococcoidia bacterium]|nr:ABC transporter substrate-binding protein [Dehalococcoidia bacterium]